ncbi:MAG: aminotransferase class I/II-fold pyridoxal phosphate-dependent enzyme, partial [Parabacteroides sp.]|nr:aminotransferase class I/II-fold pyridoxal phosphate-dependent enzyme [Parabacteroides sp.]
IVLQTLSKAWGAAGIRLGMAFASPEIIGVLNKNKYPNNVNQLTQEKALELLSDEATMRHQVSEILTERNRLEKILSEPPFSYQVHPSDANFLLVNVTKADAMYNGLVEKGIVVRNRSGVQKCRGCLRITIGTPKENNILLKAIKNMKL